MVPGSCPTMMRNIGPTFSVSAAITPKSKASMGAAIRMATRTINCAMPCRAWPRQRETAHRAVSRAAACGDNAAMRSLSHFFSILLRHSRRQVRSPFAKAANAGSGSIRRLMLAVLCGLFFPPAYALEKVSVQLNWKHQFQFAGYYAAIEKGYFRDAGYEVELRELPDGSDPIAAVLKGEADYGVAASEL